MPSNEENVGDRVDTVAENVASVTNTTNDSNISDSDDSNSSTTIKLNVNTVTETEEQSSELPVNENRNETVESRLSEDTDKKIIFKNEKDCRGKNNYLFLDAIGQENKLATGKRINSPIRNVPRQADTIINNLFIVLTNSVR